MRSAIVKAGRDALFTILKDEARQSLTRLNETTGLYTKINVQEGTGVGDLAPINELLPRVQVHAPTI